MWAKIKNKKIKEEGERDKKKLKKKREKGIENKEKNKKLIDYFYMLL